MSEAFDTKPDEAVGRRLAKEVGILAGRLSQLLMRSLPQSGSETAEGQSFLWAAYQEVAGNALLASWQGGFKQRAPAGAPHPLDRLVAGLGLTDIEVELLILAGMAEENEGYAAVLRTLHPATQPRPTLGLAAQLLCGHPDERLKFRALVESSAAVKRGALRLTGDAPFFDRTLQLADSLWSALHGIDVWPAAVNHTPSRVWNNGLDEWLSSAETARVVDALGRRAACTVLLTADHEETAHMRALALVAHAGLEPAAFSLPPTLDAEMENLIALHTLMRGQIPVVRQSAAAVEGATPPDAPGFEGYPAPVVICARTGAAAVRGERPLLAVGVERMSPAARRQMWRATLPELDAQASFLAARYPVEPAVAGEVAADVRLVATMRCEPTSVEDVTSAIRARGGLTLSGGIKLIRPRATFDDLVLPADRMSQLREAIERLMLRARVFDEWGFLQGRTGARGVRMMFSGPPGTGKTLSAEVLAQALGVDLLVVDISRVVSKWIGETEKNLSAVFDTAERAQAVLFFDEADALFGKRTEVSDAHDRYANLETAYLLARLERFEGLAVLATNLRQNIDPAFLRRLEFVVDFSEPDRVERHALWRAHVPADAPLDGDVNLYELAALYPVVGGIIRNAAVAAGFLAASDGTSISRTHFIHAIRREYEKAGRAFPGVPAGSHVSVS